MKPGEYVTADTHFGHKNIVRLANRPFESIEEMNRELVKLWNAKVPENAVVYHLGDFALAKKHLALEVLDQLNGHIRLVLGNHDQVIKGEVAHRFEWVKCCYQSKTENGVRVIMNHFPFLTWKKSHQDSWHLHGHEHGSLPDEGLRRLDVGVDAHPNYEPFSYHEVYALMQERRPTAHQGGHDERSDTAHQAG